MTDRAQSELIGFALVFGIVVLSLLVVSVAGYTGLQNAQEHQQTTNVQPAFEVLSNNVDDVVHYGAPSRATEIKLADASLSIEESLEITVEGESATEGEFSHNYTAHSIVYDSGSGTEITYVGGMLVREDDGNAVAFGEPNFVFTEERVTLPIVSTYPEGTDSVGGSTTLLVETRHSETELYTETVSGDVTIDVDSSHPDVWGAYLEGEARTTDGCEATGTKMTCEPDRVSITVDRIGVRLA